MFPILNDDGSVPNPVYVLDTNILVHYTRRTELQQKIEEQYHLLTSPVTPALCYVSEAELRAFARRRNWGAATLSQMNFLLSSYRRLPIEAPPVLDAYIAIDSFSGLAGREMGKNDLWIASVTAAAGATLLTTDKDFDHLNRLFLSVEWIDPVL